MKKSARLFVCLRPSAAALQAWDQFRSKAPTWPLRWMPVDSLHITLKFLGETKSELLPNIAVALEKTVVKVPMLLGLKGGGIFPSKGAPSIFWAGVDGEVEKLNQLAASVEQACEPFGFKAEPRPFHPHLSVARLRADYDATKKTLWLQQAYQEWIAKFESTPFVANEITLMQSFMSAAGARYETVALVSLSTAARDTQNHDE